MTTSNAIQLRPLPEHVNMIQGYTVLGSFRFPKKGMTRSGRVILVDRGPAYHDPFTTAVLFEDDREWWQGHYYRNFGDALECFSKLCREWGWP